MQRKNTKNEYEILSISEELVLVKCINQIYIHNTKMICEQILRRTNNNAFWFNNLDTEEIEIYTKKGNQKRAKEALEDFEVEYNSILRKRRMIIAHRHRKE